MVFCCSDPHLVMTYDSVIGLHSLWEITKAKPEVCSVKSVCFSVDVILRARKVSLQYGTGVISRLDAYNLCGLN